MTSITLAPIRKISGEVSLPGSKSLSNRALLLSSLALGKTRLTNLLRSEDTHHMVSALRQLGVSIEISEDGKSAALDGKAGLFPPPGNKQFFLGNAGTAIRPLTSILALIDGTFEIDGDEYMRERPIENLTDALQQLGAVITYLDKQGYPPLRVTGGKINGGHVSIPGNISSQYLTSLLMSLPLARQASTIEVIGEQVSKPYLDITLGIMARFGVTASHQHYQLFNVPGNQQYQSPGTYMIEGDASSASYFFAAAAVAGSVRVNGLGKDSVQGDLAFVDVIERMGASVVRADDWIEVHKGSLTGVDMDLNHIPDAAMTIATLALFAKGTTTIRNIYNWRVKETDRMLAMATGLRRLGATVKSGDDYIIIEPPKELNATDIDTYGDHRVAMSFSLAALGNKNIQINNPECTAKTFPDYFDILGSISHY